MMDDRLTRRSMTRLLTGLTGAVLTGAAGPLGTPSSKPVLTVSGKIKAFNDGELVLPQFRPVAAAAATEGVTA